MKKIILLSLAICLGAWNVQAADGLEAGGGVGFVDLGGNNGSTWIAFVTAEMPLDLNFGDSRVKTSVLGRLGTSGTATQQLPVPLLGTITIDTTLDYFLSGLFKVGFEVMPDISAYGMAGFTFGSTSVTVSNPLYPVAASGTDSSFSWGIGVDYRLDNEFTVGADYTAYWSNLTSFAVNLRYHF